MLVFLLSLTATIELTLRGELVLMYFSPILTLAVHYIKLVSIYTSVYIYTCLYIIVLNAILKAPTRNR
jgi:hypothetical protein